MPTIKALLARFATLVVGLVCGLAITHLVIRVGGPKTYAAYATIVALPALVPFVDLGAGAALVNRLSAARIPDEDEPVRRTALSVLRVMLAFSALLASLDLVLYATGGWSWILGDTATPSAAAVGFYGILIYALAIPLFIGARVLLGLEKTHTLVLAQGIQTPLTLALIASTIWAFGGGHSSAIRFALYSFVSMVAVLSVSTFLAARLLPKTSHWLRPRVLRLRRVRGAKVMDTGWPVLIQTLATPLATQLDRIMLAQVSVAGEVAKYSLAAQLYAPLLGLAGTAGVTLWPMFQRQQSQGGNPRPLILCALFAAGGAASGSAVWAISPVLFHAISGGTVVVPPTVMLGFTVMLAAQCALQPLGMFLMDTAGARQQVGPVIAMIVVNVALSYFLARELGAAGPVLASAVAIVALQVLPFVVIVRGRLSARRGT